MKRVFKYVAIALTALIVAVAAMFAMIVVPLQSAPASQIAYGVHFVSDGSSTIAIVPVGANQALLVDSGMDGQATKVLTELSKMGMSAESVIAILFTHGHPDHIGGAKRFPLAQLMALQPEVDLVAGLAGAHGPVTRLFPIAPTGLKVGRVLQDGETVTVGQTPVKVFAVPGHTTGSAAYLIDGVLFLGDSANATTSGRLQSAVWIFSDDLRLDEASLRGLANTLRGGESEVRAIAFGHSGVLGRGLNPLTDWVREHAE